MFGIVRHDALRVDDEPAQRTVRFAMKGFDGSRVEKVECDGRGGQWNKTGYAYTTPDGHFRVTATRFSNSSHFFASYFLRVDDLQGPGSPGGVRSVGRALCGRRARSVFQKLQRVHIKDKKASY